MSNLEEELSPEFVSNFEEMITNMDKKQKISMIKKIEIRDKMIEFANNHHHSANGEQLRFDNDSFPHIRELYEEGALHQQVTLMAGTQIGKTDWLIVYILAATYCGLNVFYVLPKDDMRDTYVTEKVLMRIKLSPFYQDILKDSSSKSKDLINFGKGTIKFVGANSSANFASFSADIVVVDETDEIAIPKHIGLSIGRMTQSIHKFVRYVSNPTGVNGFISKEYEKTDKRVRMFPCDKCGTLSELDWYESMVKLLKDSDGNTVGHVLRDKDWTALSTSDIQIKCPCKNEKGDSICDGNLCRFSEDAAWVATTKSNKVGYKMPTFVSPNVSMRELYDKYLDGLESPSAMESFYTTCLAEPYSSSGNKVSEDVLERCTEYDPDFSFVLKEDQAYAEEYIDKPCVMGVDTADDHWDITISHQERKGDPNLHRLVFIGKMSPRDGLYFLHELVDRYNVVCTVIDHGPQTLQARAFQNEAKCTVWRCVFNSKAGSSTQYKHADGTIIINRREMLDKSYAVLKTGRLIIPYNYTEILEGTYVKEITALSRITEQNNKGVFVPKWVGPSENHLRLSDGYRNAAAETLSSSILTASNNIYISK